MTRHFWVLAHRYAGLTIALFFVVAGLTGSILAFYDEIDGWLNPDNPRAYLRVAVHNGPMLDPFDLRARALALVPQARVNYVDIQPKPGEAYTLYLEPRIDPSTGQPYQLGFDTIKLNPYTGAEIVRARVAPEQESHFPLTRKNILKFIYALHFQLALGETGGWVFGIAAMIWTVDCFVGFYLTLPIKPKKSPSLADQVANAFYKGRLWDDDSMDKGAQRSFWLRWKPSWLVKWRASTFRVNFDLHRAFGLWAWPMLFVFAWSSVMFNLPQAYDPVMNLLFEHPLEENPRPELPWPHPEPVIDFRTAHSIGQRLMAEQARLHGFIVKQEGSIFYHDKLGVFFYSVQSDRDISDQWSQTSVTFDAISGKLLRLEALPSCEFSAVIIRYWLWTLHMARIWGLPYKLFVCLMGLVITMLSITGIYIWLRKRRIAKAKLNKIIFAANIPELNK